ncbi:methyltransferase, FxLD system [Cryptosporangium sp. NPDC048952]|uniref:methyltransferase, FxLD system n=1 Tax=Cryptosporangium sp. NPDC048952 TaxID=3363961 RepID=UPI00371BE97C
MPTLTGEGSGPRTASPDDLRMQMVSALIAWRTEVGSRLDPAVEAAMMVVPRHLFLPGTSLEEAYRPHHAVVTRRGADGRAYSSVSAAGIVAMMLTQLQVRPGDRCLEIGSGGYNAALLARLAGPAGRVTSVDIDPVVAERARSCLTAAGYDDVAVHCADGEYGAPDAAQYDRIIVTVQTTDIPPAWREQLTDGGRLVVPLTMRGVSRAVAFTLTEGVLVSDDYEVCGFVPMQGAGAPDSSIVSLHGGQVRLDTDPGQQADAAALDAALAMPRVERWTGVMTGRDEPYMEHLGLWLATQLPQFCVLSADREAVEAGVVEPTWAALGTPAVTDGTSFAYRAWRDEGSPDGAEIGVYAHGPNAEPLAAALAGAHQDWDREQRHLPPARINVHPAGAPRSRLPEGYVLDRPHSRLVITWPRPS